jgi:ABC-type branched-subunit amino acid transport system ATPase component
MLEIAGLVAGYGGGRVLDDLSLKWFEAGRIHGLAGRNGMGKSTLLKTIMGLVSAAGGSIRWQGEEISELGPAEIARRHIGFVPQGRRLFAALNVEENIRVGGLVRRGEGPRYEDLAERFPVLRERRRTPAGLLSGGEQQQVALARALAGAPRLLLLDELSEGIQPSLVTELARYLREIVERDDLRILLVEQNVQLIRQVADHCGVIEKGRMVAEYDLDGLTEVGNLERHLAL